MNSEEYTVAVKQGITVGYSEDFEGTPTGWTSSGVADGARVEVKAVDGFKNEARKIADGKLYINVE